MLAELPLETLQMGPVHNPICDCNACSFWALHIESSRSLLCELEEQGDVRHCCHVLQVLLLDELTTFLDGEDQRGVLEAVRACVGGPDQVPPMLLTCKHLRPTQFPRHASSEM